MPSKVYTNFYESRIRIARLGIALISVALTVQQPSWAGGEESLSVQDLVRQRVSTAVGRPVDIKVELNESAASWILLCGQPTEQSGKPFEIARSRLAKSEFGASFCALLRAEAGGLVVVEFDIGSNDMPAVDWIERHDLPPELLSPR